MTRPQAHQSAASSAEATRDRIARARLSGDPPDVIITPAVRIPRGGVGDPLRLRYAIRRLDEIELSTAAAERELEASV
jgi:hypothetical protein